MALRTAGALALAALVCALLSVLLLPAALLALLFGPLLSLLRR